MTSTELTRAHQSDMAPAPTSEPTTALQFTQPAGSMRLVEWAHEAQAANHLAKALVRTPFAGAWRGDEDGATAAILKGAEVGLTPVTALGAFDNIQGTPAPKAMTLRALVQSQGHDLEIIESTEQRAVARYRRYGRGDWLVTEFTLADAERMRLLNKDNWVKQPRAMMEARVTSKAARLVGSDVILGIGYSAEELHDQEYGSRPSSHRQLPAVGSGTAAERLNAALSTDAEDEAADQRPVDPGTEADEPIDVDPVTGEIHDTPATGDPLATRPLDMRSQLARKMFALLGQAGVDDNDQHAYLGKILGRDITSRKDLTQRDAITVVDHMDAVLAGPFGQDAAAEQQR